MLCFNKLKCENDDSTLSVANCLQVENTLKPSVDNPGGKVTDWNLLPSNENGGNSYNVLISANAKEEIDETLLFAVKNTFERP